MDVKCLSHDGLNEKSSKINILTRRRAKCPTHPVVSKLSFMGCKIVVMAVVYMFTDRLLALLQIKYTPEDIKCSVSNVCCLSIYLCSIHPKCHCINDVLLQSVRLLEMSYRWYQLLGRWQIQWSIITPEHDLTAPCMNIYLGVSSHYHKTKFVHGYHMTIDSR